MFILIGRVPEGENGTMEVAASSYAEAVEKFITALYEDSEDGARKECEKTEGFAHYMEFAVEIEANRYRIHHDPGYGEDKSPKWEVTAKPKIDTGQIEVRQQMGGKPCDGPDGGGECHHTMGDDDMFYLLRSPGQGEWNACALCTRDAITDRVEELTRTPGNVVKI